MKKDGIGGANTLTGLIFEGKTDLETFLVNQKYYASLKNKDGFTEIFYNSRSIAYIFKKYDLYRFLSFRGVNWQTILSKRLLPDDAIYVIVDNILYIIECKFLALLMKNCKHAILKRNSIKNYWPR
jgi:hypothetical protein